MVDPVTGAAVSKAVAAVDPAVTEFAKGVTGAPGNAIGGMLADRIGYLRWKSGIKMLERAAKFAEKRGIKPEQVPLKNFVPILEGSSLEVEDDEPMIDRWASLLVNSALNSGAEVPPSFARILRDLSSLEAQMLDRIYNLVALHIPREQWWYRGLKRDSMRPAFEIDEDVWRERLELAYANLLRLGLCQPPHAPISGGPARLPINSGADSISLSEYGYAFVNACRQPEDRITPPAPPPPADTAIGTSGVENGAGQA